MASKASSLTSTPPNVSASETTPSLSNSQAFTRFVACGAGIEAEPYDFRGSAPDVEHHGRLGVLVGEIANPCGGEMRLSLAVDNFELDAEPFANHGDEVGPVGGRAAGFGGDRAGAGDPARHHLVAAYLQGLERACDRRLAQASGQRQPLAQANDARKRVDDPESLSGRPRDKQPTIVGSEIQRRISPAPAIARAGRAIS